VCDSLHNNFTRWSSTSIYAVLLNFETENVETYKFTSTIESASEEIACTPWMSIFVWACPSDATGEKKQMIMTGICQSFVVWPISVTDMPTYKTYTYFFILFVHRNSIPDYINTLDGNTRWERISFECQVQSTSIQQKKSFTPFYNVIFITFDIYHHSKKLHHHTHTTNETMNQKNRSRHCIYL